MLFWSSVYSILDPTTQPSFRTERADFFFPIRFLRMGRPAQREISLLFEDARSSSVFECLSPRHLTPGPKPSALHPQTSHQSPVPEVLFQKSENRVSDKVLARRPASPTPSTGST